MTISLVGPITDRLGHAQHSSVGREGPAAVEHRTFNSSLEYCSAQPPHIGIDLAHDGRDRGEVVYLERGQDDDIVAVRIVSGLDRLLSPSIGPVFFSPTLLHRDGTDVVIESVGITGDPATCGLRPLTIVPGDCRDAGLRCRWHNKTPHRQLLERAADACSSRRFGSSITIIDPTAMAHPVALEGGGWVDGRGNPVPESRGRGYAHDDEGRQLAIEHRPGGRILSVH